MKLPTEMITTDDARRAGLRTYAGPFYVGREKNETPALKESLANLERQHPGVNPELTKSRKRDGAIEIRIVVPAAVLRNSDRRNQHSKAADDGASFATTYQRQNVNDGKAWVAQQKSRKTRRRNA